MHYIDAYNAVKYSSEKKLKVYIYIKEIIYKGNKTIRKGKNEREQAKRANMPRDLRCSVLNHVSKLVGVIESKSALFNGWY